MTPDLRMARNQRMQLTGDRGQPFRAKVESVAAVLGN